MLSYSLHYLIFINVVGVLIMKIDKSASKIKGMTRVPERTLWVIALFGGAIGTTIGMYLFRHKTRHVQFKIGFPLIAIVQITGILFMGVIYFIGHPSFT